MNDASDNGNIQSVCDVHCLIFKPYILFSNNGNAENIDRG